MEYAIELEEALYEAYQQVRELGGGRFSQETNSQCLNFHRGLRGQ